jgi:riboflavin synthase
MEGGGPGVFTGIIEHLGAVASLKSSPEGARLAIYAPEVARQVREGESVSVNGACLTVVERAEEAFSVDVTPETLRRTNLGELEPQGRVNLELPLQMGGRLGGHLVSGHVDAAGRIVKREPQGNSVMLVIEAPPEVMRYVVQKGSIAVDGVSLTVAERGEGDFSVAIIPHTAQKTTLVEKPVGARVNLEADLIGKYVEQFVTPGRNARGAFEEPIALVTERNPS